MEFQRMMGSGCAITLERARRVSELLLAWRARLYTTVIGVIDNDAMHESVLGCETHSRSMCTGGEESTGSRRGYAYMSDESPRQPRQNQYESVTCACPCALTWRFMHL
jgi:hypothetical protein